MNCTVIGGLGASLGKPFVVWQHDKCLLVIHDISRNIINEIV